MAMVVVPTAETLELEREEARPKQHCCYRDYSESHNRMRSESTSSGRHDRNVSQKDYDQCLRAQREYRQWMSRSQHEHCLWRHAIACARGRVQNKEEDSFHRYKKCTR